MIKPPETIQSEEAAEEETKAPISHFEQVTPLETEASREATEPSETLDVEHHRQDANTEPTEPQRSESPQESVPGVSEEATSSTEPVPTIPKEPEPSETSVTEPVVIPTAPTDPPKEETQPTEPEPDPEPVFDIDYWIGYAKSYAMGKLFRRILFTHILIKVGKRNLTLGVLIYPFNDLVQIVSRAKLIKSEIAFCAGRLQGGVGKPFTGRTTGLEFVPHSPHRINKMLLLEGAVIVLACIIFSVFASSPPVVDTSAAAVTQVWAYIGELVFNMLVLVGSVKMSDRIIREMMGL